MIDCRTIEVKWRFWSRAACQPTPRPRHQHHHRRRRRRTRLPQPHNNWQVARHRHRARLRYHCWSHSRRFSSCRTSPPPREHTHIYAPAPPAPSDFFCTLWERRWWWCVCVWFKQKTCLTPRSFWLFFLFELFLEGHTHRHFITGFWCLFGLPFLILQK